MAYDNALADRVRAYLAQVPKIRIEEKKMFSGLAFLVHGKMCINITGPNIMCRFDPAQTQSLAERPGFSPVVMRGKVIKGYCRVGPEGIKDKKDFEFWMNTCLDFNDRAKASRG